MVRGVSVRQTLELLVLAPARVSRVARVRPAPRRARRALAIRLAPGGAPGAVAPRRRVIARLAARRLTGVDVFRVFLVFLFHARVCVRAGGRVVRVIHQKPGAAVHLGEARECVAAAGKQVGEEAVVVARAAGVIGRAAAARDALLREHTHGRALVRARDAVRSVHVAVARHAQVRLVFFFGKRDARAMCVSCRRGRRDAERRTRAGVTRRGERSGQRARLGTRDAGGAFRERARRASLGIRRSRRVADDDRRPRRLTRETSMDAGGLLFSRRRGISGTRPRSAIETAPAGKCARERVPCPARNKPPPVSGARCRTPRTGTTSDGATRVYFCCESGHRTLYRGRRCRCSSRWRRWRCCTACKASSQPIAGLRDDTDPSRPRVHASPRPRFSRPDATRRLFPRRLPRKTDTDGAFYGPRWIGLGNARACPRRREGPRTSPRVGCRVSRLESRSARHRRPHLERQRTPRRAEWMASRE